MNQIQTPLEDMTLRQLRRVASAVGVSRYSRMRKDQLLESILSKQGLAEDGNTKSVIEAAKFDVGQDMPEEFLSNVDEGLNELPDGYGHSRIELMPRDPQWAYAYWDIPNDHKLELRSQGGQTLALRLYDVTDIRLESQAPHSVQEYPCDELAREWYMPIPVSDRDYMAEIGYRCQDGRWLMLSRSATMRIPPVYPSEWVEDHFLTVPWDQDLRGQTLITLTPPAAAPVGTPVSMDAYGNPVYDGGNAAFGLTNDGQSMHIAGSLYGSMQHLPSESLSSFVFPSGMGMWAMPTVSGMSGVGMSASMPPVRPRQFWLVADAELIVYGATEPDATVTIGGQPIKLNSDGTFRFQMSFQDGVIDFPIVAVAADGEQNREIHMNFERETPARRTNTKEEAVLEWFA
jgi:uncharacterized protein